MTAHLQAQIATNATSLQRASTQYSVAKSHAREDGVNGVRNVRLWRRKEDFQAPARCNTLPCIIAIHYHVFSQYTAMYSRNTQSCVLTIRNHVLSQFTTMYHQSTQQCILAVHLCSKPPSFAIGEPRTRAKALCCD